MSPNIESGLEVREDASRLPEAYTPEAQKEATTGEHSNGPLLGGEHLAPNGSTGGYSSQDVKSPADEKNIDAPPPPTKQRICGLSPALFGFTTALIAAIVVGAAVGGGLGGAYANAKSQVWQIETVTITSTPLPTTTTAGLYVNYTAAPAPSIYSLYLPCPAADGNTYTSLNGQTWAISCSVDEYTGDIGAVLAYKYEDCVEACAAMNTWQHAGTACSRVQFSAQVANVTSGNGDFGNCWLKNASAVTTSPAEVGGLSARLTSDS